MGKTLDLEVKLWDQSTKIIKQAISSTRMICA
jgi:hypothetical protein